MIVIGIDPHMKTHTAVALEAATGERPGERSVCAAGKGTTSCFWWARGLGDERVFAIDDCRHVSGRLERYVLPSGEAVVRRPRSAS